RGAPNPQAYVRPSRMDARSLTEHGWRALRSRVEERLDGGVIAEKVELLARTLRLNQAVGHVELCQRASGSVASTGDEALPLIGAHFDDEVGVAKLMRRDLPYLAATERGERHQVHVVADA